MENTTDSTEGDAHNNYTMADENKLTDAFEPDQLAMADLALSDTHTDTKPDSMKRFFGMPELLAIVAEKIRSRHQLSQLCLVTKIFDEVFSRELFRHIFITYQAPPGTMQLYSFPTGANSGLSHSTEWQSLVYQTPVSKITHARSVFVKRWLCERNVSLSLDLGLHHFLNDLVQRISNLRSFGYDEDLWVDGPHVLMGAARYRDNAYPDLQSLRFDVYNPGSATNIMDNNQSRQPELPIGDPNLIPDSIRVFSLPALKALAIHFRLTSSVRPTIDDRFRAAAGELATFLVNCTGLQYLSIRGEVLKDGRDAGTSHMGRSFFRELCTGYRALGGNPLQLKALCLGRFVSLLPYNPPGQSHISLMAEYLGDLTWTDKLEELQLWNAPSNELAWDVISPEYLPALKRLHLNYLDSQGYSNLVGLDTGVFTRQLHLTVHSGAELLWAIPSMSGPTAVSLQGDPNFDTTTADSIDDNAVTAFRPRSLALTIPRRCIPVSLGESTPWSGLKYFKAVIPDNRYHLSQVADQFVRHMQSLEFLWISFTASPIYTTRRPAPSELGNHYRWLSLQSTPTPIYAARRSPPSALGDHDLLLAAQSAAGKCGSLKYVGFDDVDRDMQMFKHRPLVYKVIRDIPVLGEQGWLLRDDVVQVDEDCAYEVTPVEFWSNDRKMAQFVDGGCL